ncbi:hypothetical protein Pla175_02270 [Pirellulimonas nuda]|uniref:Uncharacterized protein n=1 Tax=Pirellulimonas nuda TaxID=2528009 RepID=A0A518D5X7_9BACT|nr:hypothetical protein Pla175_02270 [Pirellulimonas nuda]
MLILAHLTPAEAPSFWLAFLAGAALGSLAAWTLVGWRRR